MDAKQLTELVVRPELKRLGLHSEAAEQLIIGTIFTESLAKYLKQHGSGPALGIIQMEPVTHNCIWTDYLKFRKPLAEKVLQAAGSGFVAVNRSIPVHANELISNLRYAVAMCRVHYLRVPNALPAAGDIHGLARYWKQHYNTPLGKGKVTDFVEKFPREILKNTSA
ncbi:hypothetical protein P0F15_000511 [Vibrio metschnikovii]|uniref:Uncharacterized protein n=1 Tax=bacterium 19PA01SH03 TaxID=2920705 RepID=A0AAU6SR01_UNCXX|nr:MULTISPECIES: hypothetical protein [unclassified Vibrio]EKO3650578.1 hypothetical protein [Vibrio metschnikovii]EKO3679191.1 hypothetical protein [Vibrio metschnikovii]EKO3731113.1 hypothetical protein [Vibrio metschnikovii]EKO3754774.1 hypothetical protein [Vibrio metschnikovii]MDQ2107028.1 hypothetical protein [Vibrio sp. 2017_1457_15]